MFLWLIRQLLSIRHIVAGRNHPHQLAWGLALGALVGIVPHGNLLALTLIGLVLALRVNHAMATLTGVAVAFSATALDPYTHLIGRYVLTHPQLQGTWANLWQMPLAPWTDLNNTVVMGSLLVGLATVLPAYAASYPVFRYFAPPAPDAPAPDDPDAPVAALATAVAEASLPIVPCACYPFEVSHGAAAVAAERSGAAGASGAGAGKAAATGLVMLETQIDVIRLKDYGRDDAGADGQQAEASAAAPTDQAQMNQALSYLLRRLRDSQQGKAA